MRIQKLKIFGFKSFAQKVEILFEGNGLTAIVGPNGCGKSNIVDAIRWVMGEQRAGYLRADRMQGVIFSGTAERPAMSMAEVSLVIENDRGLLPSEYSEVMITRKIFSNGESLYLINNQECRLADIRNLFADTGMGAGSYSQMDDRMVKALLSDKADDRRTIFEEAAGVSKYKKQRKDASAQLERVTADMERIATDLQYAKNQFRQQERMLARSQELRKLKQRLKEIDISISIKKYTEQKANEHAISTAKIQGETELENLRAKLTELETKIEEKRLLISGEEEDLRESEREVSITTAEVAKLNEAYIHLQNREGELEENAARCKREIDGNTGSIENLKEELQTLENELKILFPEIEEIENSGEKEIETLQTSRNLAEDLRIRHKELSNKRLASVQAEGKLKSQWQKIDTEIEMLESLIEQGKQNAENLDSQIQNLQIPSQSKEELNGQKAALNEDLEKFFAQKAALLQKISRLEMRKKVLEKSEDVNSLKENKWVLAQRAAEGAAFLFEQIDIFEPQLTKYFKGSFALEQKDEEMWLNTQNCEGVNASGLATIGKTEDIEEEKKRISEVDAQIFSTREKIKQTETLISQLHITDAKINSLNEQKQKSLLEISNLGFRLQSLKNSASLNTELNAAEQELEQTEREFERVDEMLREQEQVLKNQEELTAELTSSLNAKRTSYSQKENRLHFVKEQIQTRNNALTLRSEELDSILSKKESLKNELENKSLQIEKEQERLSQKESRRDAAREKYDVMAGDIEEWRSEVREINNQLREKAKSFHDLDLAIQAVGTALERMRERIFAEWEYDLEKSAEEQEFAVIVVEERDANIEMQSLREKIKAIGPVNASAAEDFEAEKQRVLSIEAQYNDLNKARTSLETAMNRLDIVARDRFLDTFRKIQRNYQDVFTSLMPGGEALLFMQNDSDPLEAEIEINACPPGKKMRGVKALSAGEQALTATSLLFALYMVKPSPYCILDEIDGPLDDANIGRFMGLLRRFSHQTQFVVITHNKRTMAASDRLYGVTQEIKGISKVGSVRLEDING